MPKHTKKRKSSKNRGAGAKRAFGVMAGLALVIALLSGMGAGLFDRSDVFSPPDSGIEDDGQIRVFLKSLARPVALGLTVDGEYTVDGDAGFRFAKGSEISVACDSGTLLLSCGGLTIDMGAGFRLTRHAPVSGADAGGLYIHESSKDALFKGDLSLSYESGGIDAILAIDIEEYLYGVVAYEMSDSFPLEALKAQAVAARTYAMRAKSGAKSKAYDVVDTTADQVYKGYDPKYTNVIRAVDETRGIVGMVDGEYAGCFYTASNGGQIASAKQIWGGGGEEHIEMKLDPYDLENPLSTVKRASIPFTPDPGSPLADALISAISEEMATMGYSDGAGDIRIDRIISVTPAEPDVEGSLMFNRMDFEMSVSARKWINAEEATSGTATPGFASTEGEPVLSDITPIEGVMIAKMRTYGLLEDMLGLSINSSSIETFSVEITPTGFDICSRRYGHGVGMSQRGAQTMAGDYGKTCEEILAFYYPGMQVLSINWQTKQLTPISSLPESVGAARPRPTPKPTPAPLRALSGGEYYARVKLETASSTLNVREQATVSSRALGTLDNNSRVIVLSDAPDGWLQIETAEISGFVKGDYIVKE